MAANKDPFCFSRSKDGKAHTFRGLVQAGGTQAIKIGEICCFNKTAGYWIPVSAVADFVYALAIAAEEQKASSLMGDDVAARYIKFYSLHPDDVFEFQIAAARALALGDGFILTAADSQKLTYSAAGYPVAYNVHDGHYPESGTTIRNQSYAQVQFNPDVTAWGLMISKDRLFLDKPGKILNATANVTLYPEMSGLTLTNTGANDITGHVLPQTPPAGTRFKVFATAATDVGFEPGAGGGIYVEGAKQADGGAVTVDAIADSLEVIADGAGDWHSVAVINSAADQTGGIDVT